MFNPRVGPFCDFLTALSEVRPFVPYSSALENFHRCSFDAPSIDGAASFLPEEIYQSMKGSGKLLFRSLKRAIPSQNHCRPCLDGGRKCEKCLFLNAHLKLVSAGLLSVEAVREYNARYVDIIVPFARWYPRVYIVDVANMLRSNNLLAIVTRIEEHSNGDHLALIHAHIQRGLPQTNPDDRIRFLEFFLSFMDLVNHFLGYTAGFIFVNQCHAVQELGIRSGPHYKWINVSFALENERMHTITGFDGSDDAMMVEIHRRLRNDGLNASIVSEDRFSEYIRCNFSPTRFSVTPHQLAFPPSPVLLPRRRPREWDLDGQAPPAVRRPPPYPHR